MAYAVMMVHVGFDAGSEAKPVDGADRGIGLQLVEYLHANGYGGPAWGGDYDAATADAGGGAADAARRANVLEFVEFARQG